MFWRDYWWRDMNRYLYMYEKIHRKSENYICFNNKIFQIDIYIDRQVDRQIDRQIDLQPMIDGQKDRQQLDLWPFKGDVQHS